MTRRSIGKAGILRSVLLASASAVASVGVAHCQAVATDQDSASTDRDDQHAFLISLPVKVNGKYSVNIDGLVSDSGTILLNKTQILVIAKSLVAPAAYDAIREAAGDAVYASDTELSGQGFQVSYDSALSEVNVTLEASMRSKNDISILRERTRADDELLDDSASFTSFLNVFTSAGSFQSEVSEDVEFNALFDLGVRMFGADGLALRAEFDVESAETTEFQRGDVFLFKDDYGRSRRYSAGDLFLPSTGLQNSVPFAGLAVEKVFSIRPREITRPVGSSSFILEQDSVVRVLINNNVVRTLQLESGPYDIRNFPFVDGVNDVQIEILDQAGRTETIEFTQFFDDQLLRKGLHEYGYAVGVERSFDQGEISYQPDDIVWSAFHRYGITDNLSVGANAQGNADLVQAGLEALVASPLGTIDTELAYTQSKEIEGNKRDGFAASVDYSIFLSDWNRRLEGFAAQVSADYTSENFASFATPFVKNDIEYRAATSLSFPLPADFSGSLGASFSKSRIGDDRTIANASISRRFFRNLSSFVTVGYQESAFGNSEVSVLFSLTATFGARSSASARYNSDGDEVTAQYLRANTGRVGSLGYSLNARRSSETERSGVDGSANYTGNRFTASATQTAVFDEQRGQRQDVSQVNFATSFVFSDGLAGFSRPVRDGFAIIERHRSLEGATVVIGDGLNGDIARSDWLGPAVAPNIIGYQPRRIDFDVEDAPLGYDFGDAKQDILLPEVGSKRILVGSEDSITALGILVTGGGEPVALMVGEVTRIGAPETEEPRVFFTNSAGRFAIQKLRPGNYEIRLNDGRTARFSIDEEAVGVVEVEKISTGGSSTSEMRS
jgi:outer membrane usher protein